MRNKGLFDIFFVLIIMLFFLPAMNLPYTQAINENITMVEESSFRISNLGLHATMYSTAYRICDLKSQGGGDTSVTSYNFVPLLETYFLEPSMLDRTTDINCSYTVGSIQVGPLIPSSSNGCPLNLMLLPPEVRHFQYGWGTPPRQCYYFALEDFEVTCEVHKKNTYSKMTKEFPTSTSYAVYLGHNPGFYQQFEQAVSLVISIYDGNTTVIDGGNYYYANLEWQINSNQIGFACASELGFTE